MSDPFGQWAGVASAGNGDVGEVSSVEGEPDQGRHETWSVVIGSVLVVVSFLGLSLESGDLGLEKEDAELVEALAVLDSGRKSLCDLNRIARCTLAVSEDVEPCSWRDREGFLLVADRGFAEDFPSDIEGKLGGKGDRVVVGRGGKGGFVKLTGRGLV